MKVTEQILDKKFNYPSKAERYTGSVKRHYVSDNNIPVWINENGILEPYTHQDEDYSNLCLSEWCRCKQ